MESKDFVHLLVEIRDLQREHLEEYRRVTRESLELQRRAVARQEHTARIYRWMMAFLVVVVLSGLAVVLHGLGLFHKL
jgi:hypothetical protein